MVKHARGTIGYAIAQLVKKHGNSTNGIYILRGALARALGAEDGVVKVDDKLTFETDRYKKIEAEERRIMAKYLRPHPESDETIATE